MAEFIPLEKRISADEMEVLAEGFEGIFYRVFKKWFLEEGRVNQARRALLANAKEPTELSNIQGNAEALKGIHTQLKEIHRIYEEKKADKRSG